MSITIGGRSISSARSPFVIAEMSGNHNGSLERALDIVRAAAAAGADAIKLQTYTADTITLDVDTPAFRLSEGHDLWGGRRLYDLYREASTPWEWHEELFAEAGRLGILAFSSPFDPTAVAFLDALGVPAFKIASSEIVDLPLIETAAATGKPIIISTGMATMGEIDRAIAAARRTGNEQIAILKCSASYPAPLEESNLAAIPRLRDVFGVEVGYSDHTHGIGAAIAAVTLGASIVEKHVTLSRQDGGVDADFSLEPTELAQLVCECTAARASVGGTVVGPTPAEAEALRFRRSLYVTRDVSAGEVVGPDTVRSVRPAGGLPPESLAEVTGRVFTRSVPAGTPLTLEII
jgi:N-acetylneuraminate synthase